MKIVRNKNILIFKTEDDVEITRIKMKNERTAERKLQSFIQHILNKS